MRKGQRAKGTLFFLESQRPGEEQSGSIVGDILRTVHEDKHAGVRREMNRRACLSCGVRYMYIRVRTMPILSVRTRTASLTPYFRIRTGTELVSAKSSEITITYQVLVPSSEMTRELR